MKEKDYIRPWVDEAMKGNASSLNNILNYYHAQLFAFALKICRYADDAADALQDAYLNIYIHFREIREPNTIFNWMLTIVKRSCWQQINSWRIGVPLSSDLMVEKIIDNNLEHQIENNDMNSFLWERISQLSEPLRIVVILRYFSVFNDYEYIARILGIPVGTVRSRLNEAKSQLKKIWEADLSGMPDSIRNEAEYWNDFYCETFAHVQSDAGVRKNLKEHLLPGLTIRFSNGEIKQGRKLFEKEIEDDMRFGTSYRINSVFNLNHIGILQGENINSSGYPDRCPKHTTIIFYRKMEKSYYMNFHIG